MIILYTTFPTKEVAENICRALVDADLIKCANISSGTSIFKWQGKLEATPEIYAYLKTTEDKIASIEAYYDTHHPYDVYCLVQFDPSFINQDYKDWITSS